jgi:hypothetical protein
MDLQNRPLFRRVIPVEPPDHVDVRVAFYAEQARLIFLVQDEQSPVPVFLNVTDGTQLELGRLVLGRRPRSADSPARTASVSSF